MEALSITLPIFALIGAGWLGTRLNLFDEAVAQGLARFVFWLAFPALLLSSMAKAPAPDAAMAGTIGLWLTVLLGIQVLARLAGLGLGLDRPTRNGVALAASCGNTAFLGTAILVSLMGPTILPLAAALVAVENIVVVALAVAGLKASAPGTDRATAIKAALAGLVNPVSMGAAIGFVLAVSGLGLAPWLARPIEMLGAAASPAGLVSLGIVMAGVMAAPAVERPARGRVELALAIGLKTLALPLVMWTAFSLAGADPQTRLAATLLAACPSAVNVFIQARQAGLWAGPAALAVIGSTLVSLLGLTVVASLG
jgi:malonate transporter and related proteins